MLRHDSELGYQCGSDRVARVLQMRRLGRQHRDEIEDVGSGGTDHGHHVDMSTYGERLVFAVFRALAEFERVLIRERTQAGLAAARARGEEGRPIRFRTATAVPHERNQL